MKVYHEIRPETLESALKNGLVCTSRGDKGDDTAIVNTDKFLDNHLPRALAQQGVSRDNNLYAYVHTDGAVIDITNGAHVPIDTFVASSKQQVLELDIDPERCFVSDLDSYDALKSAFEHPTDQPKLELLAKSYWNKVTPLSQFNPSSIRRPEIMITYDVAPGRITAL